ncbi:MAG: tRNA (N(6)-L-threonylcarbamoyladenosine(37)-C(2))-methylthiotransferase MtaB [Planctomycetaceae bacterium]|nr:tRNA (N(6)-L-threonylcarbamoyladenosine(37)-C(2))-methylthiotransferase MtaB [Planctomycetaceae bacterium]
MTQSRLRTLTLGCKVNQYETEFVRQGLVDAGAFRDANQDEAADLCVVNTCTVTNEGDSKSRQAIRKLARQNPDARLIVMGCYATRAPEELAQLPGVVEVVTDKRELPDLLGRFGVVDIPNGISRFGNRHRAYIKVQDGCLLRCSYCIIPKVRPQMSSRPLDEIVDEARRLANNGYREIVLTGIHLGHYGVDQNWNKPKQDWLRLSTLLRRLMELPADFRVRLSSIEATEVTRELLEVMSDFSDRICPHLHVCLQSGSDRILRAMKRRWGTKRFIDRCALAQEKLHKPALTTDVIVGFPGETEEDFEQTCELVRQVGFSKVHVFPFSPRRGTPAAEMADQLPKGVKSARGRELARIESELREQYFSALCGEKLQVMVEGRLPEHSERVVGTSCRYAPVQLENQGSRLQFGQLIELFATSNRGGEFISGTLQKTV